MKPGLQVKQSEVISKKSLIEKSKFKKIGCTVPNPMGLTSATSNSVKVLKTVLKLTSQSPNLENVDVRYHSGVTTLVRSPQSIAVKDKFTMEKSSTFREQ